MEVGALSRLSNRARSAPERGLPISEGLTECGARRSAPVSRCPSMPSQPVRAREPPLLATEKELQRRGEARGTGVKLQAYRARHLASL